MFWIFKRKKTVVETKVVTQFLDHPVLPIKNKERKFGENEFYYKVTTSNGIYLFTRRELEIAAERAYKNLEDL